MQITKITYENMEAFRHMAPQQLWEPEEDGYFSVGGLWDVPGREQAVAAGCLIFRVQYELIGERMCHVAVLKWLFVEEAYRRNGLAAEMLDEWRRIVSEAGLEAACLRLRTDQDDLRACLEKHGFVFETQTEQICRMPLAEVSENLQKAETVQLPVSRVCEMREQTLLEGLLVLAQQSEKFRESGYLLPRKDAYEQEMSCGTIDSGKLRTLLLMQKQSDIELRIVAFRSFVPNGTKELLALLRTAISRATQKYGSDTWLEFYCPDEQMKEVARRLSEDCEDYEMCRGVCMVHEDLPFMPGEALTYLTAHWRESRLGQLQRPTIVQGAYISSLDEWTPEETLSWKAQGEALAQFLLKVERAAQEEMLAPEFSFIYRVSGQVRAMLLVTGNPQAAEEDSLFVSDWYIHGGKAYREFYYLLQILFDAVNSNQVAEQKLTFVCNEILQKRLVEYLMEGGEKSALVQPAQLFLADHSMIAVRFQSLTDLLAQKGFASVLQYPPVGAAYLEVYLKQEDQVHRKVVFTYEPVGAEETVTGFVLHAGAYEPIRVTSNGVPEYLNEAREEPLELDVEATVQWMTGILNKVQ